MLLKLMLLCLMGSVAVCSYPYLYKTERFRVGIEYDKSLPMNGGSDRYRHRNNLEPFFVTVTASARNGFVISYMDVSATVAEGGDVDFQLVRGSTGSQSMVFQLVSNNSDFLSFQYLAYGIREEEYKKITNIITLPIGNNGPKMNIHTHIFVYICLFIIYQIINITL